MKISKSACIKSITAAAVNRHAAFLIEMAVGVALFASAGRVDKTARADVYDVYSAAGYDCLTAEGADYRTVHRRITAAASLYQHIGAETIEEWTAGATGTRAITAIVAQIDHLDVATVNGVLAMTGRPVPRVEAKEEGNRARRAEDRAKRIDVGHAHVLLDDGATEAEIMDLVARLLEVARALHADPNATAVDLTPGPA